MDFDLPFVFIGKITSGFPHSLVWDLTQVFSEIFKHKLYVTEEQDRIDAIREEEEAALTEAQISNQGVRYLL